MNFINKALNLLFWAIFIFISVSIALIFVFNLLPDLETNIVQNGIGAFFGAFFVFLFLRISDWISRVRKGNTNHFNSLVKIERLLNRTISRLEKNILSMEGYIEALHSMKILIWKPISIQFNFEFADDVKNIDFINDFFPLSLDMETLNNDIVTLNSKYDENKGLFLEGKLPSGVYEENIASCRNGMAEIVKFMKAFQEKTIILQAKARIIQKEKKYSTFLIGALPKRHYGRGFDEKLKKEIEELNSEVAIIRQESQAEIDRIRGIKASDAKPPQEEI